MNAAVSAALSVVAKALAPVSGSLLEAWAASNELGPSIDSLKTELLYTQATLETSCDRKIEGPALEKLLQKMRDSAHNAEDVLDELDYFRIQDELYGIYEAAAKHAKGCGHNLVLNAQHTTKALGKLLACSSAASPRHLGEEDASQHCSIWPRAKHRSHHNSSSTPISNMRKLGKLFPCSSFPPDHDEDDSRKLILCGACIRKAPHKNQFEETPKLGFDRVHVSNRMKQIVEQLRSMRQEVSTILLGCGRSIAPDIAHSRPITTSESVEPELYGRDLIMNSIIHHITKGKYCGKDLTVLPIVGVGGIGKTTLTQHIYHSQEIQIHFPVIIWVCVSLSFNPIKLLQEIEGKIPKVEGEKEGTAGELIQQRLRSRRFLLIMDDMWECTNEDDWKRLLLPLRKSQENGNVIILTTRLPELAQMVKTTDHSIELGGLHPEEFRKLFLAFVFGDEQCKRDHILLLRTGDKIMEKLKGSPLAAKTVGRLLRNRLDLYHWRKILESKEWETQSSEHDIMPALKLSYDYLPFHLQQCFSYCSLFPEDYKFDSKELIHLWIGLNILPFGCRNKTVEDIGLSNLNDLVTHGFFRKEKTSGHSYYIIHDLLHDLALRVASHECLTLHHSNVRSVEIFPSIRHLSIIIDSVDDNNMVENFKNELRKLKTRLRVENLQTLMLFGGMDKSFAVIFGVLFREANSFRVLRLPKMPDPVESMLHNFSALVHLRYLSLGTIRGSQVHLPKTISRFYHLRILDLHGWHGCPDLSRDMCNLTKLCHFLTMHDKLHSHIYNVGKLELLQELKAFAVNKESEGFELNQLKHLIELREVGIYNLERIHTKEEAVEAKLIEKDYLHTLTLDWDNERSNTEPDVEAVVLENLQPHRNLQELCIRGHKGPSCPTWLGGNLVVEAIQSLHLVGVSWDVFPSFGKMWNLCELTLEHTSTIKEFVLEQSFHGLIRLTLVGLESFEKWVPHDTHVFPLLQVLILKDCPKLLELPCLRHILYPQEQDWNIDWFPKLQELEIENCPEVLSLPPIPWTRTLCSVKIKHVGSKLVEKLEYSKSSSGVALKIVGKEDLHSLCQLLVFDKLKELQKLKIEKCPSLELKHLVMLTSLKELIAKRPVALVGPIGDHGGIEWQHLVEHFTIISCGVSGKEFSQLLSHLPKRSVLVIVNCENITQLVVGVDRQQTTIEVPSSSSLDVKMEYSRAKGEKQKIVEEEEEDELLGEEEKAAEKDDGLLVLPAHLYNSLQRLNINSIGRNCMVVPPLHALQALRTLELDGCSLPSYSSSCHPFPSTLLELVLCHVEGMETLEPLSNLTCLTRLDINDCGDNLRWEGLLLLHTQGQLRHLVVCGSPDFFVGLHPSPGLKDEQEQSLPSSSKLGLLMTDDVAGVLIAPVCSLLSSSLTQLFIYGDQEVGHFTKEQEEALQLLTSLHELEIMKCYKLWCLPAGLNKLTNLKLLRIDSCPSLQSLPKGGLPISLQGLDVRNCGSMKLKQQCRRLTGTILEIILE